MEHYFCRRPLASFFAAAFTIRWSDILECGDVSPLSNTGTRPGVQSADPSAHSK